MKFPEDLVKDWMRRDLERFLMPKGAKGLRETSGLGHVPNGPPLLLQSA